MYVSGADGVDGTVSAIDIRTGEIQSTVQVATEPVDLLGAANGRLISTSSSELLAIKGDETVGASNSTPQMAAADAPTSSPDLSVFEVVGRAQSAVLEAGAYRYEFAVVEESGEPSFTQSGEVVIGGGQKFQDSDGLVTYVDETGMHFYGHEDGTWSSGMPPHAGPDQMTQFLGTPVTDWALLGTEQVDGHAAYMTERIGTFIFGGGQYRESYWIDAETFLPIKRVSKNEVEDETPSTTEFQTQFFDFGAAVDVQVPPEALAPTPTPEPAIPLTSDDPTAIAEGLLNATFANDLVVHPASAL